MGVSRTGQQKSKRQLIIACNKVRFVSVVLKRTKQANGKLGAYMAKTINNVIIRRPNHFLYPVCVFKMSKEG